jgi:acetyl-CoA carboxylase beta subunit
VVEIEFIGIWPSTDGTVAITAAQLAYTRLAEPGAELATAGRGLIDK